MLILQATPSILEPRVFGATISPFQKGDIADNWYQDHESTSQTYTSAKYPIATNTPDIVADELILTCTCLTL